MIKERREGRFCATSTAVVEGLPLSGGIEMKLIKLASYDKSLGGILAAPSTIVPAVIAPLTQLVFLPTQFLIHWIFPPVAGPFPLV
jgi:hypothetical protein